MLPLFFYIYWLNNYGLFSKKADFQIFRLNEELRTFLRIFVKKFFLVLVLSDVFGVEKEPGKLEGILAAVYQNVFGKEVYPSI